jgi:hypothetical protein
MHAGVFGEFGMERCRHDSSLPDGDWSVIFAFGGDYFYGLSLSELCRSLPSRMELSIWRP